MPSISSSKHHLFWWISLNSLAPEFLRGFILFFFNITAVFTKINYCIKNRIVPILIKKVRGLFSMMIITLIATIIAIIGCVNWFLVGVFTFNLVTLIFGAGIFARIIYAIVGLAGFWLVYVLIAKKGRLY